MDIKTIIKKEFTHVTGRELNAEELNQATEACTKIGVSRKNEIFEVLFFQDFYNISLSFIRVR